MADWAPEALDAELSAYLDGELSPAEAADIERRLRASPEARARLEALRSVAEQLRGLPRHAAPPGVAEAVREAVAHSATAAAVSRGLAVGTATAASLGPQPAEVKRRSDQSSRRLRLAVRVLASAALVGFGMVAGRFVLSPPPVIAPATVSIPGLVPPPPWPESAARSTQANGDGLPPQQAESVGKSVAAARGPGSLGQPSQATQRNDGAVEPPAEALRTMSFGVAEEKERSIVATLARRLGETPAPAPETARVQIVFAPRSQAEFDAARDALHAWTRGASGAPDDAEVRLGFFLRGAAAAESQTAPGDTGAIDATLAVNPIEVGQIVAGIETAAAGPRFENWILTDTEQNGVDELAAGRGGGKAVAADRDAAAPPAAVPPAQPTPPAARRAQDAAHRRETTSARPRAPRAEPTRGKADNAPASPAAVSDSAGRVAGGGRGAPADREATASQPTAPPPGVGGFTAGPPHGAPAGGDYKQLAPGAVELPPGLVWMRIVILPPPPPPAASAPATQPHSP